MERLSVHLVVSVKHCELNQADAWTPHNGDLVPVAGDEPEARVVHVGAVSHLHRRDGPSANTFVIGYDLIDQELLVHSRPKDASVAAIVLHLVAVDNPHVFHANVAQVDLAAYRGVRLHWKEEHLVIIRPGFTRREAECCAMVSAGITVCQRKRLFVRVREDSAAELIRLHKKLNGQLVSHNLVDRFGDDGRVGKLQRKSCSRHFWPLIVVEAWRQVRHMDRRLFVHLLHKLFGSDVPFKAILGIKLRWFEGAKETRDFRGRERFRNKLGCRVSLSSGCDHHCCSGVHIVLGVPGSGSISSCCHSRCGLSRVRQRRGRGSGCCSGCGRACGRRSDLHYWHCRGDTHVSINRREFDRVRKVHSIEGVRGRRCLCKSVLQLVSAKQHRLRKVDNLLTVDVPDQNLASPLPFSVRDGASRHDSTFSRRESAVDRQHIVDDPDACLVDAVRLTLAAEHVPHLRLKQAVVGAQESLCTNGNIVVRV